MAENRPCYRMNLNSHKDGNKSIVAIANAPSDAVSCLIFNIHLQNLNFDTT